MPRRAFEKLTGEHRAQTSALTALSQRDAAGALHTITRYLARPMHGQHIFALCTKQEHWRMLTSGTDITEKIKSIKE